MGQGLEHTSMLDQILRCGEHCVCKISMPSVQEGPHSIMNEEEFFDALEIAYHDDELLAVRISVFMWYVNHSHCNRIIHTLQYHWYQCLLWLVYRVVFWYVCLHC